jgi:hypothetical protein
MRMDDGIDVDESRMDSKVVDQSTRADAISVKEEVLRNRDRTNRHLQFLASSFAIDSVMMGREW